MFLEVTSAVLELAADCSTPLNFDLVFRSCRRPTAKLATDNRDTEELPPIELLSEQTHAESKRTTKTAAADKFPRCGKSLEVS